MIKQIFKSSILSAAVPLLAGCATAEVTNLKDYNYKAKPEDCAIEVLATEPKDRKFDGFAYVSARGGATIFDQHNLNEFLPEMKKKACAIGADALLIQSVIQGGVRPAGGVDPGTASALAIKFL